MWNFKYAAQYLACVADLETHPDVQSMRFLPQHAKGVSTYDHCCLVAYSSFRICAALGLGTAAFSHQRRHGHRAWGWIPLALGAALLFPLPMGAFPFQGLDPAFLPYLETEVEVYTGSGSPVPGLTAFLLTGGSAAVLINAALMICGREPFYEN